MKKISVILICVILAVSTFFSGIAFAADVSGNKEFKPLDMVVVMDVSGSMNYSDSTHMTSSAVTMLVNMMPAENSRIGIVTFNTKAQAITCDSAGKPTLLNLKEFDNVKTIEQSVEGLEYKDGTGIGNALKLATDLLASQSTDSSRQKAILLFTDGMDDFGYDQLSLARCKENQSSAVQWATNNDCPVYCVGYNYANSMGPNGEGITKLESISKSTGGQAKAITDITQIEDLFINMLANICDLYYKEVKVVPGDGRRHEVEIYVSPAVVEANIRIACNTPSAIANGTIELYNPNGEKVTLQNGNGIRYDVDATAASIKVIAPKTGTWKLVLEGITGDAVRIGLLEHYELGIVSNLVLPDGNPTGIAYVGDQIGIEAYLTTDGNRVADTQIYDTITSARAIVTPVAAPEQQVVYALSFDGQQYTGTFPISMMSVYEVVVEIGSDTFIRTTTSTIQSSNHPLILEKPIDNVKLNKNKQIIINDIYTYVSDPEQDQITAAVTNSTDPDMAKAEIKDDQIIIDGLGWGATNVTVTYTDIHGNSVDTTFKVSVNDPVMLSVYIGIFILIVILILLLLYWLYKKTFRITGRIRVLKLAEAVDDGGMDPKVYNLLFQSSYGYDSTGIPKKSKQFGKNQSSSEKVGFGKATSGFGSSHSGFATPNSGFGEQASGFGKNNNGFSKSQGSSFGASGGFGSFGGSFGEQQSGFGVQQEEFVESIDDSKFNGEMELGLILGNEQNLFKILDTFADKFEKYMTNNGAVESQKAKNVRSFINQLSSLRDAKIVGSSSGLKGIQIKLPKKIAIKSHSLKIERQKIKTNVNNGKFVTIKLSLPLGEENGKKLCYYIEVEYKN